MNQLPLLDAVQFQRAFSTGANVTLLAANIRNDPLVMTGSGIYTPFSATYHHAKRGDPEGGRLIVARVPVLDPLWVRRSTDVDLTESTTTAAYCHRDSCADPPVYPTFTSSMMHDPFKFVLLKDTGGDLTVCDGTFCCHLRYKWTMRKTEELYALGAFAGTHKVNGRYVLQVSNDRYVRIKSFFYRVFICLFSVCRCAQWSAVQTSRPALVGGALRRRSQSWISRWRGASGPDTCTLQFWRAGWCWRSPRSCRKPQMGEW